MDSEYHDLELRLDQLFESTEKIRTEIHDENKTRSLYNTNNERRMRTNRVTARIAVVVAVVGILVGLTGVSTARTSNHAAQVARAATVKTNEILATSRKASCDNSVDSVTKTRKGQKDQIVVVVDALLAANQTPPTPAIAAAVTRFYVKYDATVDTDNPVRDCTPRGIACFLKLAPPAGSKPCAGYDGYLPN